MTAKNLTVVITGSHHTPAIELIKQLRNDHLINWHIEYVAQLFPHETHISNTIIGKLKVPFHNLDSGKYDRRWLPNTLRGIPLTLLAIIKGYRLLKKLKPDIVVSFGGYVSVPIVFASWLRHIPSITHEQTSTISLATKINGLFVRKVALSFPISNYKNKTVVTGNLLRSEIYSKKSILYQKLDTIIATHPLIYITGGSQGSHLINNTINQVIPALNDRYTIIHSLGNIESFPASSIPNYYPTNYINLDDIGWVLNNAQVIISRSGANICQEIVALGKKSVLIPLPISQQNEQLLNARWVQKQLPSSTIIIKNNQLTTKVLLSSITKLINTPNPPHKIAPQTNHQLLQLIHEII